MIKKFEHDVQLTAAEIVDDLLATGPCDFVEQVSARLPLKIICKMMGIGDEHYAMVLKDTNIILSGADPEFLSADLNEAVTQILTAGQELAALVTDLAAHRHDHPSDDLTSALATANIDGEQLTEAELASFFILLVVAGNETTRTAISHALMLLTDFPGQRDLLLADLDDRLAGAVEEIVRYAAPVIWMRRTVTRDHAMNGHNYRAGDKAVLLYWAANRDEAVFDDQPASISAARPTRTLVSALLARTSALGRTWPAERSRRSCGSCWAGFLTCTPPGRQSGSSRPARAFAARARMNSRSESRFR